MTSIRYVRLPRSIIVDELVTSIGNEKFLCIRDIVIGGIVCLAEKYELSDDYIDSHNSYFIKEVYDD